jgi:hypothetical protein
MAYVTVAEARTISGVALSQIDDTAMATYISYATALLNREIGYNIVSEHISMISSEMSNEIDGVNKTYYIKEIQGTRKQLGDRNNDGSVTATDIYVYSLDSLGTRYEYTVSTVDASLGKFTLSAAPQIGVTLYASYFVVPIDCSTPDFLVKMAISQLAGALAYTYIDSPNLEKFRIGKVSVLSSNSVGYSRLMSAYYDTVSQINTYLIATEDNLYEP